MHFFANTKERKNKRMKLISLISLAPPPCFFLINFTSQYVNNITMMMILCLCVVVFFLLLFMFIHYIIYIFVYRTQYTIYIYTDGQLVAQSECSRTESTLSIATRTPYPVPACISSGGSGWLHRARQRNNNGKTTVL